MMPLPRLITLIIGLSFIFGLILWLVNAIYRLYLQVSFTAPLLANLLVLLIILLLGLCIGGFVYYFQFASANKSRGNANQRRKPIKLPAQKTEAAGETLKAVRRQVQQIEDQVAQEALLGRSQQIEENLTQGGRFPYW